MTILFIVIFVVLAVFLGTALIGAPYVPSHAREVRRAFTKLYPLGKDDVLLDIGSGDGVVLLQAAKCGARAIGYEINPFLVLVSEIRLHRYSQLVVTRLKNFWTAEFPSEVTVVYTFGENRDIAKMYARVQHEADRLDKTIMFISYGFEVPGKKHAGHERAHFLYKITPLHNTKP